MTQFDSFSGFQSGEKCVEMQHTNSKSGSSTASSSTSETDFQQLWGKWTTLLNRLYDDPRVTSKLKTCIGLKKTGHSLLFIGRTYLLVFLSLPGSTGDEVKSWTVPQQPPVLSSHSDAVQHHGCSPCWTFLHFCSCDHYYVCNRFCFL